MNRKLCKSGFSLIETLIAVAIFASAMFIVLTSFTSFNTMKTKADTINDLSQQARYIFEKLTPELKEIDQFTASNPISSATFGEVYSDSLEFTLRDSLGRSGYRKINYTLDPSTNTLVKTITDYSLDSETGTYYSPTQSQHPLTPTSFFINYTNFIKITNFQWVVNPDYYTDSQNKNLLKISMTFVKEGRKIAEQFSETLQTYVFLKNLQTP